MYNDRVAITTQLANNYYYHIKFNTRKWGLLIWELSVIALYFAMYLST